MRDLKEKTFGVMFLEIYSLNKKKIFPPQLWLLSEGISLIKIRIRIINYWTQLNIYIYTIRSTLFKAHFIVKEVDLRKQRKSTFIRKHGFTMRGLRTLFPLPDLFYKHNSSNTYTEFKHQPEIILEGPLIKGQGQDTNVINV